MFKCAKFNITSEKRNNIASDMGYGQDGRIPAPFFLVSAFYGRDEVHKHTKKERGQYPAKLGHKKICYMANKIMKSCRKIAGNPERA